MAMTGMKIVVIGAGIGGLSVARACALRGADVTVLEQAEAIKEVGAGLQISPNGFAVLRGLGLGEAVSAASLRAEAVALHDYRHGPVVRLDLTRLASRDYFFVHRADLIDILATGARAAGVKIRLLQRAEAITPGVAPRVDLANGASVTADLVIGADGLNSRLRPVLNGAAAPFFTRQVAWRAVVPNRAGRGAEVRVHMGPHRHVVSYPLRGGEMLNIVAVQERDAWASESWSQQDDPAAVEAAFADFCPEVRDMLGDIEAVNLWGLFRHPVARVWHRDGTVLLGDAAHPTLPFLAQGASMALEDAWVLAEALSADMPRDQALQVYQSRREGRVRRVIAAANGNARKYHLAFSPLRWAAHSALRLGGAVAPLRMMRQFDWLYGYDVTAGNQGAPSG